MADDDAKDVLLKEIDQELKKERYADLWKKYGNAVIGVALALVVGTAAWKGWSTYQEKQRRAEGERFARAAAMAAAGRTREAAEAFGALARDAGAGYATLARLKAAALLVKTGDVAGAIATYDALARDSSVDKLYRDLATLLSVLYAMDGGEPSALMARIEPLTAEDNPWHYSALEITALLAERGGDRARAREVLTRLGDDDTAPAALRQRARELLTYLKES